MPKLLKPYLIKIKVPSPSERYRLAAELENDDFWVFRFNEVDIPGQQNDVVTIRALGRDAKDAARGVAARVLQTFGPGAQVQEPEEERDVEVEIADGRVYLSIKIPESTCAACGATWKPPVTAERVAQFYKHSSPLSMAFTSPWCGYGWRFVDGPQPGRDRALICDACAAPLAAAEEATKASVDSALANVRAKIRRWE